MAKVFSEFTQEQIDFIKAQKMFFVATAPQVDGKVNVSPKGYDTLKILHTKQLIYADYYGSGNETATHIKENNRVTFMWNSYDEAPLILRAYGEGRVVEKGTDEFSALMSQHFPSLETRIIRQLFLIHIFETQTSCGWGVPLMRFENHREKLDVMSKKSIK